MIEVGTILDEKIFYIDRAMLKAYADASGDQNTRQCWATWEVSREEPLVTS